MWSPRHVLVILFLCLLAGSLLFGCRAWEPEAIIVNRAPETYIIGSPAETSGAYFHFHVYWYGTDADGFVERFVWALTDTSIQDIETDDDEEDLNFNPALNVTTLDIGTYTSRTDTVFDFQIDQGANLTYDMTLHMVAQDDRGQYDRTPARLHFFSNALGNPSVQYYRDAEMAGNEFTDFDTVAFGEPLFLKWAGTTPNIDAYDPTLLAERDTVPTPPLPPGIEPDGLLGFQWSIPSEGIDWQPRAFDEATGDSFAFFGNVTELTFLNDGSGTGIFGRVLDAGLIQLLVNTIDVAGVQVPPLDQGLRIVVNYDPDTYILRNEAGPPEHNDPQEYPYYVPLHGEDAGQRFTFSEGDTVPDGAHVVFKALGWDDPRDSQESSTNRLTFQGQFIAGQNIRVDGIYFTFSTTYSDTHQTPEWTAELPTEQSADTLRFEVGPFDYSVVMRAVDEQGTRDGRPDTFKFVGNYPPCVQCVEVTNILTDPTYQYEDPCYNQTCMEERPRLQVYNHQTDPRYLGTGSDILKYLVDGTIYVRSGSGQVSFEEPVDPGSWKWIPGRFYTYLIYLHGKEHPQEHWPETGDKVHERIKAWRYQVDYDQDAGNSLIDGGGADNINFLSGFNVDQNQPDPILSDIYIETSPALGGAAGAWVLRVTVGVPSQLMQAGRDSYWNLLRIFYQCSPMPPAGSPDEVFLAWQSEPNTQSAYRGWQLTTMQFSPGTIQAIAADNSTCDWRRETNAYHYYKKTKIPHPNGRRCEDRAYDQQGVIEELGNIDLEDFITYSDNRRPVVKEFDLELYPAGDADPFTPGEDPPGWVVR